MIRTRYATDAVVAATTALTALAAPAGGTGATGGAYDTAGNRDLMITAQNALRTDMIAMAAEIAAIRVKVGF